MRRLSGESAGFLSLEIPIQPMNTTVLALLRPAVTPDGTPLLLDMSYLRGHMASRLDELPAFRWRVERVPFGLHHPVFVEDPSFDLDFHLHEHRLTTPGGPSQLDRYCADLAEQAMDRGHPLWQLILVGGLEDSRQAVVLRIHHCLMDGFATLATLSRIFPDMPSSDGHQVEVAAPDSAWKPVRVPGAGRLVLDALRDQARSTRRLPGLIRRTRHSRLLIRAEPSEPIAVPESGVDAPPSLINQGFTVERGFARTSLRLEEVKLVKDVAGVSVNDVALAIVAGSLRSYLQDRSALPAQPLVATVPVGLEQPGAEPRTYGNRFSGLLTSLATDVVDPWERLHTIAAVTAEAKRRLVMRGPELLPDWLEVLPPAFLDRAIRHYHRKRCRHPERLDSNVVISNLRGLHPGRSLGSAIVEEMYIGGPPDSGVGANVVLWDYGDQLFFGILCFADSVEAPAEVARGIEGALAELVQIASAPGPTHPRRTGGR